MATDLLIFLVATVVFVVGLTAYHVGAAHGIRAAARTPQHGVRGLVEEAAAGMMRGRKLTVQRTQLPSGLVMWMVWLHEEPAPVDDTAIMEARRV